MATIPIRDVPGDPVQPSGDELILIDNGIAMQKATINDAVTPKATEIADDKIAALNLGTASQANVEDFATAAQGELADTAVQPARTITAGDGLTGGGDLSADRTISLNSASIASLAKADTAVQSVLAGANVTVDATDPQNPIISASGGGAASTDFATVADLLADDNDKIGYAGSGADTEVQEGDIITAQGFRYEVAASGAVDAHVATAGGVLLYVVGHHVSVAAFGCVGDGITNDTTKFQNAIDFVSDANRGVLHVPNGTYLLDEVVIKSGTRLIGQSKDGVVLKYSGAPITPIPAHPSVVVTEQTYKAFIRTENAGNVGTWDESVSVENLTVDWDNQDADGYGAVLVWMGNVRGCEVKNLAFAGALPADYSIPTSVGRGACVLMSYVETGLVEGCTFTDAASYEELGIRYYNRDITVRKNHFAGKGPWRHNIEVAAVRNLSLVDEWPKGIVIENNLFELHGNKQDVLSCHDGGDVIFRNNRVLVMDDLVDTAESGARCLVKRFDAGEGFLLVDGNIFDFRNVPSTVKRAFEVVRIWSDNVTVKGNIIRGRTDGFDSSLETMALYPWIGTGSHFYNPRNVIVSDNCIELYQYSDSETFQIIKLTGNGNVVQGNTLHLKNPITVTTNGPQFIDMHGSLKDVPGAPSDGAGGGRSNVVIGNTSYADTPNSLLTQINMRGGVVEQQLVVMGNPSNCAVTMLGGTPYIGAGIDPLTENGMRYAVGNIGAGTGNQQYRYHTFTWNPTSIDAGKQTDTTVAIPGLAMGDEITATFSQDLQFCTLTAYPTSPGNARVVLTNTSASTKDLSSGTVTLRIRNRL